MLKNKYYLCFLYTSIPILFILILISVFTSINFYREMKWAKFNPGKLNFYADENIKVKFAGKDKIRIILFGDSRIYQWDNPPKPANCEVINRGISGDTTAGALLRLNSDVIALKPDIVILQIGINDLTTIGVSPDQYEFIVTTSLLNFNKIIDILTTGNINVVILSIFPNSKPSLPRRLVWSDKIEKAVKEMNNQLIQLKKNNTSIIDCNQIFTSGSSIKSDLYNDTLHINQKAYSELNQIIEPVITDIINRKVGK